MDTHIDRDAIERDASVINTELQNRHFTKTSSDVKKLKIKINMLKMKFLTKYNQSYNDYINSIERNALIIKNELNNLRKFLQCKNTEEVKHINNLIQCNKKKFFEKYNQSYDDYIKKGEI
jgi:hypothetical protein